MSNTPLVSIIILNFNGKNFIGDCLDSVLSINYPNFEVIVIDNNSTDGSKQYLKNFQFSITNYQKTTDDFYTKQKNLKVVFSDRNLYFTGGNNLGARLAKGSKLIFLNSDTIVTKNFVQALVDFAGQHKNYLVQPKILSYGHNNIIDNVGGRYTFFGFGYGIGHKEKDQGQYDTNQPIDYVNGTCFMIDKDFFWQLGGFDERLRYFYEDVDLSLRAKRQHGECWYCYQSVIYHKGGLSFKNNIPKLKILYYSLRNRFLVKIKNQLLYFPPKTPSIKPRI